jgi:hypothetical protein
MLPHSYGTKNLGDDRRRWTGRDAASSPKISWTYSNATSNLSRSDAIFDSPTLLSLDVPAKDLEILEASSWISTAS